jgi:hypothetical protein
LGIALNHHSEDKAHFGQWGYRRLLYRYSLVNPRSGRVDNSANDWGIFSENSLSKLKMMEKL